MMARNVALVRTLTLWQVLREGRQWTLVELAERFSVTTRTIRRDLDVLESVGVPICHEDGASRIPGTWWSMGKQP